MKKKKMRFFMISSIILIGFLINTSSLNVNNVKALVEEKNSHYNINSFDRTTWKWSITEVVSTESTDYSGSSSLAVDNAGNIHIAWQDTTDYAGSGIIDDIFYKRWDASSSSWTITEVVSTESINDSIRPSLAVDSAGDVHIVWYDYTNYAGSGTDSDIFYKQWNASSSSWTTAEIVSSESTGYSYNPSLITDSVRNLHIAWQDQTDYAGAGTDNDIFYKSWNASLSLWTLTEIVSSGNVGYSVYPSIAIDSSGNIHIVWWDGSGASFDIFYKQWNASSSSWTTTEVVSTESTGHSYHPSLAVDSSGNVHIAWYDETDYAGAGIDTDIFYKHWDASSSSWTITEVVSTESTALSERPSLAVDSAGDVHIVWYDYTNFAGAGTDVDIFYKSWNASSSSWTITEVISTESTSSSVNPSLAINSDGTVHVAWSDWTDYAGAGTDYDVFYKYFGEPPIVPELAKIDFNLTEYTIIFSTIISACIFLFVVTRIRKKKSKLN